MISINTEFTGVTKQLMKAGIYVERLQINITNLWPKLAWYKLGSDLDLTLWDC